MREGREVRARVHRDKFGETHASIDLGEFYIKRTWGSRTEKKYRLTTQFNIPVKNARALAKWILRNTEEEGGE